MPAQQPTPSFRFEASFVFAGRRRERDRRRTRCQRRPAANTTREHDDNSHHRTALLTYRYTRRQSTHHNAVYAYNVMAGGIQQYGRLIEYWTNGTMTHHLMLQQPQQHQEYSQQKQQHHHYHLRGGDTSNTAHGDSPSSSPSTATSTPSSGGSGASLLASDAEPAQRQPPPDSRTSQVVRRSLLAGSVSGMVSTSVLYPMDVLRTKLQANNGAGAGGPLTVLRQTLRYGGIGALYTGLTLPLCAQALYKGTVFTVHNVTRERMRDRRRGDDAHGTSDYVDTAVSGFVAGAVNAGLFVTPVELVRNQLIAQDTKLAAGETLRHRCHGSWDMVRYTIRHHGPARLWRGTGISMCRDGIGVAAFFCAKRRVESTLHHGDDGSTRPTFAATVLAGGLAGLSFWIVSLPLDTVKTWIQSGDLRHPPLDVKAQIRHVYAERGPVGTVQRLLRGWQVAYTRGIPSAALTIAVYSTVYHALGEDD